MLKRSGAQYNFHNAASGSNPTCLGGGVTAFQVAPDGSVYNLRGGERNGYGRFSGVLATGVQSFQVSSDGSLWVRLVPAALPAGRAGQGYAASLGATGGFSHQLVLRTLPAGLTLSSSGVRSGTATVVGTYGFMARARDNTLAGLSETRTCMLTVVLEAPYAITVSLSTTCRRPAVLGDHHGHRPLRQPPERPGGAGQQ